MVDINQRIEQWLVNAQQESGAIIADTHNVNRPFVTLTYAQTWDGSITTRPGETLALSSDVAMKLTHQLRSLHTGILVGIGTVLADNPNLNVREWTGRDPQPIVLDSQLRMPASSKLCSSGKQRCWVLTTQEPCEARTDCDLIKIPADGSGHVNLNVALQKLHERGIHSLMVEGGASVINAFLKAGLVDAIVLTVAPRLVGGYKAVSELCNSDATGFPEISPLYTQQLDNELIMWGRVHFGGVCAHDFPT